MHKTTTGWHSCLVLGVLLIIGAYLRVHGADTYYYNPDEATHVNIASAATLAQVIAFAHYEVHPPLLYIFCHYWMELSSNPQFVRGLSLVFGLLTVIVHYRIGRELGGPFTGLCCAALIVFSHALIVLSFTVRQYAIFLFFLSAAFFYFIRWSRSPETSTLLAYASCALAACMSHFSGMLTVTCIASMGTYALLRRRAGIKTHLSWVMVNFFILAITFSVYQTWAPILTPMKPFFDASTFRALSSVSARLVSTLCFPFFVADYLFPARLGALVPLILFVATLALFRIRSAREDMQRFLGLTFIGFTLGMALLFTGVYPHLGARHSAWLMPLVLPVSGWIFAAAIQRLAARSASLPLGKYIPAVAFMLLTGTALMTYDAQARFKDAHEYMLTNAEWQALNDKLEQLGPRDIILTERDDGSLLTNLYPALKNIPFTHSTEFALVPYRHTQLLFNPYYPRSYTRAALLNTLRQAQSNGVLEGKDTIVFFFTAWSRSPIMQLASCRDMDTKFIIFPPEQEIGRPLQNIQKRYVGLLFLSKQAFLKAADRFDASGSVCSP